jgi:hypothetical protein
LSVEVTKSQALNSGVFLNEPGSINVLMDIILRKVEILLYKDEEAPYVLPMELEKLKVL